MMVAMVVMSEGWSSDWGATLAAFRPPIFAGTDSVSLFRVSLPPQGNASGGLYIVFF
jgi:hypothetical protein